MVVQNRKTDQADGASCSVGGGGRGEKGEIGRRIVREVKLREIINDKQQS